jgi:hypothetical protein
MPEMVNIRDVELPAGSNTAAAARVNSFPALDFQLKAQVTLKCPPGTKPGQSSSAQSRQPEVRRG